MNQSVQIHITIIIIIIYIIIIYGTHDGRIIWSSYRKLAWVAFEPTTTEFRSDVLTDWAIRQKKYRYEKSLAQYGCNLIFEPNICFSYSEQ